MASSTLENYRKHANLVSCDRYDPCPICYRCKLKASHLYDQCARCGIPYCGRHNEKTRNQFIKRENFAIAVSDDVAQAFKELGDKFCTCNHKEGDQA